MTAFLPRLRGRWPEGPEGEGPTASENFRSETSKITCEARPLPTLPRMTGEEMIACHLAFGADLPS